MTEAFFFMLGAAFLFGSLVMLDALRMGKRLRELTDETITTKDREIQRLDEQNRQMRAVLFERVGKDGGR